MSQWQRRAIGILTLGGSFLGVVLVSGQLFAADAPLLARFLALIFIGLYSWGVWCGAQLLEGATQNALRANRNFWSIQIPYLASPLIGYLFASGTFFFLTFQPFDLRFSFLWLLGSKFEASILQFDKPFVVGVNLFAIAIYFFLGRCLRQTEDSSSKPSDSTTAC